LGAYNNIANSYNHCSFQITFQSTFHTTFHTIFKHIFSLHVQSRLAFVTLEPCLPKLRGTHFTSLASEPCGQLLLSPAFLLFSTNRYEMEICV
jgi:hypothetical protein